LAWCANNKFKWSLQVQRTVLLATQINHSHRLAPCATPSHSSSVGLLWQSHRSFNTAGALRPQQKQQGGRLSAAAFVGVKLLP